MNIIDKIKQSNVDTLNGVSDSEIQQAEEKLNIKFPETFKAVLKEFGIISNGADEFQGLGVEGHLNIVETTLEERKLAEGNLDNYAVLQNLGIEGILIVVDENDRVYEYQNGEFSNLLSTTEQFIESQIV